MPEEPFIVNLSDPADMREKLELAQRILAEREAAADNWRGTVAFLRARVSAAAAMGHIRPAVAQPDDPPDEDAPDDDAAGPSTVDLVVEVVDREARPIRARDVAEVLQSEGHDVSYNGVRNALFYAANKTNRIKAGPGRGFYAPHAYRDTVIFDSTQNGDAQPLGLPTEAQ